MASVSSGDFVWLDLLSPDPSASAAFDTDVVGRTAQPFTGEYTPFAGAGAEAMCEASRAQRVPPYRAGFVMFALHEMARGA